MHDELIYNLRACMYSINLYAKDVHANCAFMNKEMHAVILNDTFCIKENLLQIVVQPASIS